LAIGLVLIVPLYVLPCLARSLLSGWWPYGVGLLVSDAIGCVVVGFLTNNYRFGALLYLGATALELLLVAAGRHTLTAQWVGDLFPALVAIYYAQQLFINMGD